MIAKPFCVGFIDFYRHPLLLTNIDTFFNACQEIFCFTIDLFLLIEAVGRKIHRHIENLQAGKQNLLAHTKVGCKIRMQNTVVVYMCVSSKRAQPVELDS